MAISKDKVNAMITFFNRRELTITCDLREVNHIRELLLANKIEYLVKDSDQTTAKTLGAGRARSSTVTLGRKQEYYVIYVHKDDLEYAKYLLRK